MALLSMQGGHGACPVGGPANVPPFPKPEPGALERGLRRVPGVAGLLDGLALRAAQAAAFDDYLHHHRGVLHA